MTAATADRDPQLADGDYGWYNTASGSTIYAGTLVALNASGLLEAATDSSAQQFVGVAMGYSACGTDVSAVGTVHPDGSGSVKVKRRGSGLFNFSGTATLADIGTSVFVADDQTVGSSANVAEYLYVGEIIEAPSGTTVRVDFGLGAHSNFKLAATGSGNLSLRDATL